MMNAPAGTLHFKGLLQHHYRFESRFLSFSVNKTQEQGDMVPGNVIMVFKGLPEVYLEIFTPAVYRPGSRFQQSSLWLVFRRYPARLLVITPLANLTVFFYSDYPYTMIRTRNRVTPVFFHIQSNALFAIIQIICLHIVKR
jgi:hypothetical protein